MVNEVRVSDRESVIVAGVAFSPHAQLIAASAFVFARRMAARVVFVHVGEEDAEARERLQAMLRTAEDAGECELILRPGDPEDVLIEVAEEVRAQLLITGAVESERMLQRIFGSVARRVARRAKCPVLLLPLNVQSIPRLDRVVLGVHSGEDIAAMLRFTLMLLHSAGKSRLHIVQEADYMNRLAARYIDDDEREVFEDQQRGALADTLSVYDLSGLEVAVEVLDDSAEGVAIMEYARMIGADLVIAQAPPRALTLRDRFVSHPAESALYSLPCGILLFRSTEEKDMKE